MADEGRLIKSMLTLRLDLPPSCIEFCPAYPDYFVVGTYDLQKESTAQANENQDTIIQQPQTRNGSLILFRLVEDEIKHIQTLTQPSAILDVHFHPNKTDVLAVVNSTGMVSFLKLALSSGASVPCLAELGAHRPLGDQQDVLILSCCWHPSIHDIIAITTSSNDVHVLQLDDAWNIRPGESLIHSHEDQAWTAAFAPFLGDPADSKLVEVLSGGDDFKLLASTYEYNTGDDWSAPEGTRQIGRHNYGVTAILPLHTNQETQEFLLLTGSYDDHIRVYAVGSAPRLLAKLDLGGGVWRLKVIHLKTETNTNGEWTATILASCMYAGTRIVKLSGDWYRCKIEVLFRFEEHESMNYGSDLQAGEDGKAVRIISTSFYDRRLCLWDFS
ncbi:hypothetical protein AB5N19_14253 [Seiridium cardinale]|uniref:Uncharacterized protein n=1 Tax=Seiridium cardinale TaxID=138064 RepID=A0ABR2XG39_9PEZI